MIEKLNTDSHAGNNAEGFTSNPTPAHGSPQNDTTTFEPVLLCPLCAGTSFKNYITATDHTTTGQSFNIVQCSVCNFTFTNPRPSQQSIGKYYQSDKYISHTGGGNGLFDRVYLFVRTFTLNWKLNIISRRQRTGSMLDFGCGTGEFISFCKRKGWQVTGVEFADQARAKAALNAGEKVYKHVGEIYHEQYDVITLWHVLEHIHDLERELKNIAALLKQDGTIFIAVPNYTSPDGQKYGSFWAGYDVPRHLWHFAKPTMARLLANVGLTIIEVKPMLLDAYYVSLLSEFYKHPGQHKLVSACKALVAGLRSNVSAKEKTNHSSLIYVAKLMHNGR